MGNASHTHALEILISTGMITGKVGINQEPYFTRVYRFNSAVILLERGENWSSITIVPSLPVSTPTFPPAPRRKYKLSLTFSDVIFTESKLFWAKEIFRANESKIKALYFMLKGPMFVKVTHS